MGRIAQPLALIQEKGTGNITRMKAMVETQSAFEYVFNEIPEPPETLKKVGSAKWTSIMAQGSRVNGYISKLDLGLLEELCYVYQELTALKKLVKKRTIPTENGGERINPLYLEIGKLRTQYIQLSREFGFSPSSRNSIRLDKNDSVIKEDEFEL